MLEQLDWVRIEPACVIDAGAGNGAARSGLLARFPEARWLALDSSLGMLRAGAGEGAGESERICGDMQQMPLADSCCQLLFSNLALHWCPAIGAALAEFRRVLDSPGLLFFSMFGPDTLKELRRARSAAGMSDEPETLLDMHHLGDALLRAGFADPVMSAERFPVPYANYATLERDMRRCGVSRAMMPPGAGLASRRRRGAVEKAFGQLRDSGGKVAVSIEVVYGQAWVAPPRGPEKTAEVSVEEISLRSKATRP